MKCRNCQSEIAFVMLDGRQTAVHAQSVGGGAGFDFTSPSSGQQRKLRQKLEEECRSQSAPLEGGAVPAGPPEMTALPALPELVDDVKSVQEATEQGKEEFKTSTA